MKYDEEIIGGAHRWGGSEEPRTTLYAGFCRTDAPGDASPRRLYEMLREAKLTKKRVSVFDERSHQVIMNKGSRITNKAKQSQFWGGTNARQNRGSQCRPEGGRRTRFLIAVAAPAAWIRQSAQVGQPRGNPLGKSRLTSRRPADRGMIYF